MFSKKTKNSFSSKTTGHIIRPGEEKIKKTVSAAQKKPFTSLFILSTILLVVLLAFTFKSGFVPTPKSKKVEDIIVVRTPTEAADEMTELLQKGDTNQFLELLAKYAKKDVNMVNSKGDTLLLVAATLGNETAVNELLALGADVNKANAFTKDTPLIRSLSFGTPDISKRLLLAGANLNAKNNYNQSPLFIALEKQEQELIDLFLSSGVEEGLNANYLFRAAAKKNPLGVLAMLKGGVDGNVANEKGLTPLIISAWQGDVLSVHYLLMYRVDLNAADQKGNTALMYAANYNHPDVIEELLRPQTLQVPLDVNAQNKQGQTALYLGASKGFTEVVQRLLAAGADPTLAANNGMVPYTVAQKMNRTQVLEWFEKPLEEVKEAVAKADHDRAVAQGLALPDSSDTSAQEKPLTEDDIFTAIEQDDLDKFNRVISIYGPLTVQKKDREQMSAFLRAVEKGNTEIVDAALDNSARIFESSPKGNAFHIAVRTQNIEMLKHMVQRARESGNLPMMLEYKAIVPGIQVVSNLGTLVPVSPLGVAAYLCDYEIYNYLVSIGAKPGVGGNSPADFFSKCKTKQVQAKQFR